MTNRRNIFSRFFRLLVMLHKISYAHFTEWNNKRKRKAFAAGIYFLSILPEFVLLAGTFLAARGQDGYVHLVNVPQKVVFYGLAGLAMRCALHVGEQPGQGIYFRIHQTMDTGRTGVYHRTVAQEEP